MIKLKVKDGTVLELIGYLNLARFIFQKGDLKC